VAAALAAELTTIEQELAAAADEEAVARQKRDAAKETEAKQARVVGDFVAQIAKLEEALRAAREALAPLTQSVDVQNQALSAAEGRLGELQGKQAAILRRQAEQEAIKQLRAKFAK
jgi:chromosome segregation ATPase